MRSHSEVRTEIKEHIESIKEAKDIYSLFKKLNYPQEYIFDPSYTRKIKEFQFAKDEKEKIEKIYTVMSYDKLNVFLIEAKSLTKPFVRYLTKIFSNMYVRFLLVLTVDYNEIQIVFPDYEKKHAGKHKLKTTTLILKKEDLYYTDIEILRNIALEDYKRTWRDIWRIWRDAFNVEKVTEKFFEDYKRVFFIIRKNLKRQKIDTKLAHEFTLQFLNRIMFIYFIAKKEWLNKDTKFMNSYWLKYKTIQKYGDDKFYNDWLKPLFFEAFNNKLTSHPELPEEINKILASCPYLNGGLFSKKKDLDDLDLNISDSLFKEVFEFFEKFNFTIKEDSVLDVEVAVDPQMIGYVYESLANIAEEVYEEEEDLRGDWGIFYTARVEVDFMCRRSLVEYMSKHLNNGDGSGIPKNEIYEFVFDEDKEKIEKKFNQRKCWNKIEEVLDNLSVVDPACGSGAFLVGMLNVLAELYKRVYFRLNRTKGDYHIKKRVIGRSIYGVDVMPWAVHASELRLWLQLIVETEIKAENLRNEPLLPNFSMNLRVGDSLVQQIGGITFTVRGNGLDGKLKKKLEMLKQEKEKYFNNDRTGRFSTTDEIAEEEVRLFDEIITQRIEKLNENIKNLQKSSSTKQVGLFGAEVKAETKTVKKDIDNLKKKQELIDELLSEIKNLKDLKIKLSEPGKKPFVWDIDFAEVFGEKGGFDIVIGNPPYVRQEKIVPPNKEKDEISIQDKKEYKSLLSESVMNRFPAIKTLDMKSDLYIYFYFHGLSLLNKDGTFCFITSNSWLDVGYGKDLQNFLLRYSQIIGVYDNRSKRSFEHADINTIIALFGAPVFRKQKSLMDYGVAYHANGKSGYHGFNQTAKFVLFKKPFEEVINSKNLIEIENLTPKVIGKSNITELIDNVHKNHDYRVFSLNQEDLLEDGWDYPDEYKGDRFCAGKYAGNKWASLFFRMPDVIYDLMKRDKNIFVRLSSHVKFAYGNKPGIVDFFIIPKDKRKELGIEKEYLREIVTSTHEIETYTIDPTLLKNYAFVCSDSKTSLKQNEKQGALEYIEWGEKQKTTKKGAHSIGGVSWKNVSSVKTNSPYWYSFSMKKTGDFMVPLLIREKFVFAANLNNVFDTNMFYHGIFTNPEIKDCGVAVLNSTMTYLFLEIFGRHNIPGRFNIYGLELENLLVPNFVKFSQEQCKKIENAFDKLSKRKVEKLFIECGIDPLKPIREQDPQPKPDRYELDKAIFSAMGLSKEEIKEIYWVTGELVKHRLDKEKSC